MSSATLEIVAIVVLILLNGVFAMSEIAVVSSRPARLKRRADKGSHGAAVALSLASNPNDFLSTVQVGITLIGTLAGAFGGATLAGRLAAYLETIPVLSPYSETVSMFAVVVAISYLSLIVGELVPKRLALTNPEAFASVLARVMRVVAKLASPAVRLLSLSTDLVLRLIPFRHEPEAAVTEEEIRIMIDQGARAGAFDEAEKEMVEGVFRLGDRRVIELMTPRPEVVWLDVAEDPERWQDLVRKSHFSRFLVGAGALDRPLGYVHVKDLLDACLSGKQVDLHAVLRKSPTVPESMRALRLLELLQTSRSHLAVVVDEHGGVSGLITLTDVMRAVVGDLPSTPQEDTDQLAVRREDGSWLIDGMIPVFQFKELLDIEELPGEQEEPFATLAGFILYQLGRIPAVGDQFEAGGYRYEVIDMDRNRIDRVLVSPLPQAPANG
jgi:putative hemolysin